MSIPGNLINLKEIMMKSWMTAVTALALIGTVSFSMAEEGHAGHEHAGGFQTITGEVVDLACYLGHGASGAGHKDCAQKCIASGLPVGIKSGNILYLAVGSEHAPANAALASLASQQVNVEGEVSERDGVHLIAIKKVTPKEA